MNFKEKANDLNNALSRKLLEVMLLKSSNLCLSIDETFSEKILELADRVGPSICMLKTHVDIIEDFTPSFTKNLKELSRKHNFLIFEDRKFADIGNTVKMQYQKGIYRIAEWADIVNVHTVPGPGVMEGIIEGMRAQSDPRGLIVLAQMTPNGTLAEGEYTKKSVEMCKKYKDCIMGFIASSQPSEIIKLRKLAGNGYMYFSPGVKLQKGLDRKGQRYSTPADVIAAGTDIIIVGRGIYQAVDPVAEALKFQEAGWKALQRR